MHNADAWQTQLKSTSVLCTSSVYLMKGIRESKTLLSGKPAANLNGEIIIFFANNKSQEF